MDLIVGHNPQAHKALKDVLVGMGLCASLVCSLFSSGVSCGWVVSGGVGCCRHGCRVLSGAVGACRVLSGLSGLSGCRGCRGLSDQTCKRTRILTDIWLSDLSELSGCRLSGGVGVSGWCRVGVGWQCRVVKPPLRHGQRGPQAGDWARMKRVGARGEALERGLERAERTLLVFQKGASTGSIGLLTSIGPVRMSVLRSSEVCACTCGHAVLTYLCMRSHSA